VTVIDDSYNANPTATTRALDILARTPIDRPTSRRIAVLGEMRELGSASERAHRELGVAAAEARVDGLFLLGEHAGEVRRGAEAAGLPAERIVVATSHQDLAERLLAYCRPEDVVLLKGSRGAAMEEVLRHLQGGGGARTS
jgi:UDP-N-acetylmuramoyl-tripeptide--D-alanyl-D-alanine ligase